MYTIVVYTDGDLNRSVYSFYFNDRKCRLHLTSYSIEQRATKRHKFRSVGIYEHNDRIRSWETHKIPFGDVPIPSDLEERALKEFMDRINVVMRVE